MIAAYAAVAASTQLLWLTYAPITTETAHHYGVSKAAVGWLAEIFPLLYVVLALPAGNLLDRWFRPTLAGGAVLTAAGGLVRLGGDTFAWALAGQTLVAVAQPVVLSAVNKVAGHYLPAEERANGIAAGAGAAFVGMLLALLLGPTIGAHGHIERLLVVAGGASPPPAASRCCSRCGRAGTRTASTSRSRAAPRARSGSCRRCGCSCGLVFVGFGIFVALATWLQSLLEPQGVSEGAAGGLLVGMVVAGTIGIAVIPQAVERRHAERGFLLAAVVVAALGCAALAALRWLPAQALVLVVMGVALLPALPVVLTAVERIAGPGRGHGRARSSGSRATSAGSSSRCSCRRSSTSRRPPSSRSPLVGLLGSAARLAR